MRNLQYAKLKTYFAIASVVKQKLMTQEQWDYVADKTMKIFLRGQEIASKNGLILVDTKYEFGKTKEGEIVLIDGNGIKSIKYDETKIERQEAIEGMK